MKKLDKCPYCGGNEIYLGKIMMLFDYNFRMSSCVGRQPASCNNGKCEGRLWVDLHKGKITKRNVHTEFDED